MIFVLLGALLAAGDSAVLPEDFQGLRKNLWVIMA